jgi:hypothetical protein
MNSIFLRAKHWQLFIPAIAIPFTLMIVLIITAIMTITSLENNTDRPENVLWLFYLLPVVLILSWFVQFAWSWTVLTKLSKLVPDHVRLPIGRIKFFFVLPVIYFCCLPFYIVFVIQTVTMEKEEDLLLAALLGLVVFIFHFLSIFCILHTFYFVAKTVKSAELQRNPSFSNFVGDFFLIWIFPVGIWFIQPRINRLIENANNAPLNSKELIDLI